MVILIKRATQLSGSIFQYLMIDYSALGAKSASISEFAAN